MIRKGLFVAGVVIRKRQKLYILAEYAMDTERPLHTTLKSKAVTKEQLIAGMKQGIDIENVAFEDMVTKSNVKGIHGGLLELEVLSDGNIFGAVQYRYCLGVTDKEQKDGIIAAVTCAGLGTGSINITLNVISHSRVEKGVKANIIKNTNFYLDGDKIVGKSHTLPVIDSTEIDDNMSGTNILSIVKMQLRQADIMGIPKRDFDKALAESVHNMLRQTNADEFISKAIREFRQNNVKSVKMDYCRTFSNPARIKKYQALVDGSRCDDAEMIIKIAMALPAVSPETVGYPNVTDFYSSYSFGYSDIVIWNEIMLLKCENGYILVDLITGKVMKAVRGVMYNNQEIEGRFSSVVMDAAIKAPASLINENNIITIRNDNELEEMSVISFEGMGRTRDEIENIPGASLYTVANFIGISKDGTKIIGAFKNSNKCPIGYSEKLGGVTRTLVMCDADYSLPGVNPTVVRNIEYNVEYTRKLAGLLSEKAVPLSELAKRNKCELLDGDVRSISAAFRSMNFDIMRLKSMTVDVGNGCTLYIGSDFRKLSNEHNKFKLDLSKHEDRCKLRVLMESAESGCNLYSLALKDRENRAIMIAKDQPIASLTEASLDIIAALANGDKKTLLGYTKAVSFDVAKACRTVVLNEMNQNGIEKEAPSLGVAAALAGVLIERDSGWGYRFTLLGNCLTKGLIAPLYIKYDSSKRTDFVSTRTLNSLMEAIKQNKSSVEIECKTFTEFIEASEFDLTN